MNVVHDAADHESALAAVDLNLVVAFDALAREGSVTRAARRMGVTQSAMSHALRRLRELLGDPLLVRGRAGMMLTPRGEALVVPLRSGLTTIERALRAGEEFEPAHSRRVFALASPDLFDMLMLPPLLERIGREAPGVDLSVVATENRQLAERLETGELDMAVVPSLDETPADEAPGLVRRAILRDTFSCFARSAHPALSKPASKKARGGAPRITLARFAAAGHVLVSTSGSGLGLVDAALASRGLTRRIALRVPSFTTALAIVGQSDLLLTAPTAMERLDAARDSVTRFRAPISLPSHRVDLVWHERFTRDPGHRWMRDLLVQTGASTFG